LESYKTLVTGGAGFIGSHLCERLVADGHEVTVLDNLSAGGNNIELLANLNIELIKGDLTNLKICNQTAKNKDIVFHLGAMNRAQKSILDPLKSNEVNITGTLNILEASRRNNVGYFINTSSSSVYGNSNIYPRKEGNETVPPHPYGVGKLAGEHYTRICNELYGLESVTVRLFSVYGPRQRADIDYCAVIPKFIESAKKGLPLMIYGDGSQSRSFTYVKDVVECYVKIMEKQPTHQEINVAYEKEVSIIALAKIIQKELGDTGLQFYPLPKGDPEKNTVDVSLLRKTIGYVPETPLLEGVRKMLGIDK